MAHSEDKESSTMPPSAAAKISQSSKLKDNSCQDQEDLDREATCDVLFSLMNSAPNGSCDDSKSDNSNGSHSKKKGNKCCANSLQLPMFLSKTYHMIDRCDPEVAGWSEAGDSFVVKNVDRFAASVLPLYFKHSNFSSFARQLNFYGFRKLRTEPILSSEADPSTANYVRFYHEKFQKNKHDLLQQIKRATKSDQQSKDEVEALRDEVKKVRDALTATSAEYERRLVELSYDFNRRISNTNAEFDKLTAMVHHFVTSRGDASTAIAALRELPASVGQPAPTSVPDLLQSLSQIAAASLQSQSVRAMAEASNRGTKRKVDDDTTGSEEASSKPGKS